jgi:hypothetical protein
MNNQRQTMFLGRVQQVAAQFVDLQAQIATLGSSWFEEFCSTGTNPIQDADLTALNCGFTVADLARILNISSQLNNFWNGAAVTSGMNGQWTRKLSSNL